MSAGEWLLVTSALEAVGKPIALCPARGGRGTGQWGLARGPESGWRTEGKGRRRGEGERTLRDRVLPYAGRQLLPQVLAGLRKLLSFLYLKKAKSNFWSLSWFSYRVPGSTLWPNCLHSGQTAQTERRRPQEVGVQHLFCIFHTLTFAQKSYCNPMFCFRQRKVRRDILISPSVPERGRSRSRDAYPHMARAGSRGRSLSIERRGSRNSSESSLVDMEEMSKNLFRWRQYIWIASVNDLLF